MINKNMSKVCAVIVTYNRKEYLLELLKALTLQNVMLDKILIFDNDSNDGTDQDLVKEGYIYNTQKGKLNKSFCKNCEILYFKNDSNSGGSGGFNKAIEIGSKLECDYLWCMDDDVIPENDCLEKLLGNIDEKCLLCIPTRTDDRYNDFAVTKVNMSNPFKYSIVTRKTMLNNDDIKGDFVFVEDMPFEGPLIAVDLIRKIGLPKKEFFIIFDDSEYAKRALRYTKIKYCKKAVLHKQIIPVLGKNELMNWKNYYGIRNQIWFDRNYGDNCIVKIIRPRLLYLDLMLRTIITGKVTNRRVIKKAYLDGMRNKLGKLVEPGTQGKDF